MSNGFSINLSECVISNDNDCTNPYKCQCESCQLKCWEEFKKTETYNNFKGLLLEPLLAAYVKYITTEQANCEAVR